MKEFVIPKLDSAVLETIFSPGNVLSSENIEIPVEKGTYIYNQGDEAEYIYLIEKGRVITGHDNESGKSLTKFIFTDGEIFGESSLFADLNRNEFALATEATTLRAIPIQKMRRTLQAAPHLYEYFLKLIGYRMLRIEERLENLVFKDSKTRIILFLIHLTHEKGEQVGYEMLIRKFMTHQEIAQLTGTSRQTVTTVLNDLRKQELLTFNRKRLLIRDFEALKKVI